MAWNDTVVFNDILSNEFFRYMIFILTFFIMGNIVTQVQPSLSSILSSFWIRWIVLFFGVLVLTHDMNEVLTYRSLLIAFIVSLLITTIAYLLFYDIYKNVFGQMKMIQEKQEKEKQENEKKKEEKEKQE
jgi:predicted membrane protein